MPPSTAVLSARFGDILKWRSTQLLICFLFLGNDEFVQGVVIRDHDGHTSRVNCHCGHASAFGKTNDDFFSDGWVRWDGVS